jgi:PleD family two-component response regulator
MKQLIIPISSSFGEHAPQTPKGPPSEESNQLSGKSLSDLPRRVMVVDDNVDAAQVLGAMMETHGHDCRVVFDSTKALKVAQQYKPEYVFLDLGMPEVDGYALCRQMRELPELATTIFIAQTGWSDQTFVDRAKAAGFHHHLVKPIALQEIKLIVT